MLMIRTRPLVQVILAVVLLVSLVFIGDRLLRPFVLDLSEDRLYSLSPGAGDSLRTLREPVYLTFYFSKSQAAPYPDLLAYGKRIESYLQALERQAEGKLELRVVDLEAFSAAEDAAVEAGLTGVSLTDGTSLYMGLVAENSLTGREVIPFLSEERSAYLEYDLLKLILSLGREDRPKLALLTSLPLAYGPGGIEAAFAGRSQPYVIYEQMSELFDIEDMPADFTQVPTGTDVLLVAHPGELTEMQVRALEDYLFAGGRMVAFLDPYAETQTAFAEQMRAQRPPASAFGASAFGGSQAPQASDQALAPLLAHWGVEIAAGKIVADLENAQKVAFGGRGPDSVKDFPLWIGLKGSNEADDSLDAGGHTGLLRRDVALASVETLNLASSGAIRATARSGDGGSDGGSDDGSGGDQSQGGLRVTPIARSSRTASLLEASVAGVGADPDALIREFTSDETSYILAARLSGQVTRFGAADMQSAEVAGRINAVLVADADLLEDRFWAQVQDIFGERVVVPVAGNGGFVLNLLEQMAGEDALLSLRGRGTYRRPFEKVDQLRRVAEVRFLAEETRLEQELEATEARLAELEAVNTGALASTVDVETEAEIARFRERMLETRRSLREVKRGLKVDIDRLGQKLALLNILGMPFLVIISGLIAHMVGRRRSSGDGETT